ncbi:MAG: hypothetical protein EXQ63_08950 [Ilumatobacteraceae bacterium]|nr:hypothetical protein [Ilumatobacteraceae bacterium]
MFLWFFGTAVLSVWFVFRDDRFDYRLLLVGAILPDVIDILSGGAWVMHSVLASITALAIVMIITAGRKPSRRRLLALPIGMFMHLVFDGAFAAARLFWWPLAGFSFHDAQLPSATRMGLNVLLEIIGAAILIWAWRQFDLSSGAARQHFISTGQLRSIEKE